MSADRFLRIHHHQVCEMLYRKVQEEIGCVIVTFPEPTFTHDNSCNVPNAGSCFTPWCSCPCHLKPHDSGGGS